MRAGLQRVVDSTGGLFLYGGTHNNVVRYGGCSSGPPSTDDFDGDGTAGCTDEDCWKRCTPLCPPGTSCPASAIRCGDSACDCMRP